MGFCFQQSRRRIAQYGRQDYIKGLSCLCSGRVWSQHVIIENGEPRPLNSLLGERMTNVPPSRTKLACYQKKKNPFFSQTYITKVDRSLCCRICKLRNGVTFAALTGWNFPSDVRRKWEVQWSRARSMQTHWRRYKTPINLWQNSRQTRANEERVFMWKKSPSQGPQQPKSCLVL